MAKIQITVDDEAAKQIKELCRSAERAAGVPGAKATPASYCAAVVHEHLAKLAAAKKAAQRVSMAGEEG